MNTHQQFAVVCAIGVLIAMGLVLRGTSQSQPSERAVQSFADSEPTRDVAVPHDSRSEIERELSWDAGDAEYLEKLLEMEDARLRRQFPSVWVKLRAQTSSSDVTTTSALPIPGAAPPTSDIEFEQLRLQLGYDVRELRRTFDVEQKRFLLGEPILVRFAIELSGDGAWTIDDWFYYNNRDETFLMLLRDSDGNWVSDRYRPRDFYSGGGTMLRQWFSRENPEIHWLPVQQYSAVTDTGRYDLYCIKWNTSCARRDGFPSSPLLGMIPEEVIGQVDKHWFADSNFITDYAHTSITIDRGTDAERTSMIESWTNAVAQSMPQLPYREKAYVTVLAWEHSLQNDFLPSLFSYFEYYGSGRLAMAYLSQYDRWEEKRLTRSNVAKLIPRKIDELTAPDAFTRSTAEFHLRRWTDIAIDHDWDGHRSDRPTLEEAASLQEQWLNWWKENEAEFASNLAQLIANTGLRSRFSLTLVPIEKQINCERQAWGRWPAFRALSAEERTSCR